MRVLGRPIVGNLDRIGDVKNRDNQGDRGGEWVGEGRGCSSEAAEKEEGKGWDRGCRVVGPWVVIAAGTGCQGADGWEQRSGVCAETTGAFGSGGSSRCGSETDCGEDQLAW